VTYRLAATAVSHWDEFDGYAVAHSMTALEELPLERFCSYVMWRLLDGRDAQEQQKLRAKLWRPPPGATKKDLQDKRSPWNPANENAALGAFKAQISGKVAAPQ
jgi:hypothetical protein